MHDGKQLAHFTTYTSVYIVVNYTAPQEHNTGFPNIKNKSCIPNVQTVFSQSFISISMVFFMRSEKDGPIVLQPFLTWSNKMRLPALQPLKIPAVRKENRQMLSFCGCQKLCTWFEKSAARERFMKIQCGPRPLQKSHLPSCKHNTVLSSGYAVVVDKRR